jgi:hypothetical protein
MCQLANMSQSGLVQCSNQVYIYFLFQIVFFKLIHPSHSLSPTYIKVLFLCCNYTSQHDDDSNLIQAVNRRKTYNIMPKRRRTKNGPQTLNRILKIGQHEHPLKKQGIKASAPEGWPVPALWVAFAMFLVSLVIRIELRRNEWIVTTTAT